MEHAVSEVAIGDECVWRGETITLPSGKVLMVEAVSKTCPIVDFARVSLTLVHSLVIIGEGSMDPYELASNMLRELTGAREMMAPGGATLLMTDGTFSLCHDEQRRHDNAMRTLNIQFSLNCVEMPNQERFAKIKTDISNLELDRAVETVLSSISNDSVKVQCGVDDEHWLFE